MLKCVAKFDVGHFVEQCLTWELGYRVDCDFAAFRISLLVAVGIGKRDSADFQVGQGSFGVPRWSCWQRKFFPIRLGQNEPTRLEDKSRRKHFVCLNLT